MIGKIILLVIALPVLMAAVAIFGNHVSVFDEPGFKARMAVFLTQNVAELAPQHAFPELRNPEYDVTAEVLYSKARQAVAALGWQQQEADGEVLHAVVKTPLLEFKDDVVIRVEALADGRSRLHVRSSSRLGKADFGANLRHISELIAGIKRTL